MEILKRRNSIGTISMGSDIIARLALDEINKFNGKIKVTNSKGKRKPFLYRSLLSDEARDIEVNIQEGFIDIKIFIILRLGLSISKTTNQLIEGIKERIKNSTSIEPRSIAVIVTGVVSKNIARRNIEIVNKIGEGISNNE